jgi:hypothetical protein
MTPRIAAPCASAAPLMRVTGGSANRCKAEAIWHCCADHVQ